MCISIKNAKTVLTWYINEKNYVSLLTFLCKKFVIALKNRHLKDGKIYLLTIPLEFQILSGKTVISLLPLRKVSFNARVLSWAIKPLLFTCVPDPVQIFLDPHQGQEIANYLLINKLFN